MSKKLVRVVNRLGPFYLSEILGTKVVLRGKKVGNLSDLVIVDGELMAEVSHLYVNRPLGDPALVIPWDRVRSLRKKEIVVDIDSVDKYVVDIKQRGAELGIKVAHDLDELLACSDIVTIHIPYSPATHHFLDEKRIAAMKKGSVLINTSRGDVIDGAALLKALKEKQLSGAGLDVFHNEPPVEDWEKEFVGGGRKTSYRR